MGIMIRGICRSCNKTSAIVDTENVWCHRCADDDEYRNKCDKHAVMNYLGFITFFAIIIFLMGYCR